MINRIKTSIVSRSKFLTKKYFSGEGFIFMLHRVLPLDQKNKFSYNRSLAITPEGLEEKILYFKSLDFDFISLDEVKNRIKKPTSKKWIVFTLDDGYKDNLIHGLPIFEKYNIPFTIYITNCFPNNEAIYWWYDLEHLIVKSDYISLKEIGINYENTNQSALEKKTNYDALREILRKASVEIHRKFLIDICKTSNEDNITFNRANNLSWEEIIQLQKHPLVTIGAHTNNHVSLKHQTDEELSFQIEKGTLQLEKQLNSKIEHFAYPYGSTDDFDKRSIELLKKLKFQTAVINHPGSIFKEHEEQSFTIPRMGLSDETSVKRLEELFNGRIHINFNGLNKSYHPA